jgi:hydrogenase/urease accessory protein HupE
VLSLVEISPDRFAVSWTEPVDSRRSAPAPVAIDFPPGCERTGAILECTGGLHGEIAFRDLSGPRVRVVVAIRRLDGTRSEGVATAASPRVDADAGPSITSWTLLGVEHIATGLDHVAFLLGLLLVAGLDRRIVVTVTAFTLAHSLTLALAVLDVVHLPSAPVEATIAASVVLVAREALRPDAPTLAHRAPWLVALVFGLVHGLGFAGALRDVGLPPGGAPLALLGFNLGVEIGQLALVLAALAVARLARAGFRDGLARLRAPAAYALGALGALWLVERTAAIVAP